LAEGINVFALFTVNNQKKKEKETAQRKRRKKIEKRKAT
jgi:endonuclease IV